LPNIFDFIPAQGTCGFKPSSVRIRILLQESWIEILRAAGFSEAEFFGDWDVSPYKRESSRRLICAAKK